MLPKFGKFLLLYGLWFYDLISQHKWLYVTSSYPCPWIKYLSAKITKYILKCWERSVKRKSNISFRVIKNSFFGQRFLIYMVKTFLKILLWRFLILFPAQNISLLTVQLYRVRHKIFWLCQCWYTIIQIAFFYTKFLSLMHWLL